MAARRSPANWILQIRALINYDEKHVRPRENRDEGLLTPKQPLVDITFCRRSAIRSRPWCPEPNFNVDSVESRSRSTTISRVRSSRNKGAIFRLQSPPYRGTLPIKCPIAISIFAAPYFPYFLLLLLLFSLSLSFFFYNCTRAYLYGVIEDFKKLIRTRRDSHSRWKFSRFHIHWSYISYRKRYPLYVNEYNSRCEKTISSTY